VLTHTSNGLVKSARRRRGEPFDAQLTLSMASDVRLIEQTAMADHGGSLSGKRNVAD
tara:strand:- start:669 stop:839 length:171 start_codon:yes stop_codon:yes gene_type:complete